MHRGDARVNFSLNLTQKIIGLILIGLLLTSYMLVRHSESVIEEAIMEQVKRQARVYLLGLEREIQFLGSPLDRANVQKVLDDAVRREDGPLGFSIHQIYAYDADGNIIAFEGSEMVPPRDLSGHYGAVINQGITYLGREVESFRDPASGRLVPKTDVIIPLHHQGDVVAGLEVEINLEETAAMIRQLDDQYEDNILMWVGLFGTVVLVFIWVVIQRGLIGPITRLGRLTQQIAGGNLSTRLHDLPRDEIGQLGRSINVMADSINELFEEQERAYMQSLQSLAKALEAKDAYTAKHSGRVAKYSVILGRRLGLDETQLRLLKQGALMHDLGKIGIPDSILNKPAALSEEEFEIMRGHPTATAAIMRPLKRFKAFAEIAAWHHERWDGNGYPDGLAGEAIPLLARIVAIADTWDAMTGDRVYRKGMSVETAIGIIETERDNGQWDPTLVDIFVDLIRGREEARHEVEHDLEWATDNPS